MHARQVHRLEDADLHTPGHANRINRLKYATVAEILIEYRSANAVIGRGYCPACDFLEEHLDEPVIDVERAIYSHPDWGPTILCESIRNTVWFNNAETHPHGQLIAESVQHDMALALAALPWCDNVRAQLQELLKHPGLRQVSGPALYVLLAYFNANHPNPRKYLEKPEVAPNLPADLNVAAFPAPDFAHESTR